MNVIDLKFKSGNNVEVERITLTKDEWEEFKSAHLILPIPPKDKYLEMEAEKFLKKYDRTIPTKEQPCLWEQFSEEERKKPMMLSCPCPKCSPIC